MGTDRSLDDFLGDEDETSAVSESEGDPAETGEKGDDGDVDNTHGDTVEPATPTYRFSPDGAACDACGDVVQKRWHDDGRFVCADCKEW